jgi:hypothetical protein
MLSKTRKERFDFTLQLSPMGESIQSFGQREALLGLDRLTEALRGKVRELILRLAEAVLRGIGGIMRATASGVVMRL